MAGKYGLPADPFGGADRELGSVGDPGLLEDAVKIDFHRTLGDPELFGDVAIAHALADQFHQVDFARRQ